MNEWRLKIVLSTKLSDWKIITTVLFCVYFLDKALKFIALVFHIFDICICICISIYLPIYLSIYLSVYLSICSIYRKICCEAEFYWDCKCIEYFAELVSLSRSWKDMPELLQRLESLHVHDAARTQSSILT